MGVDREIKVEIVVPEDEKEFEMKVSEIAVRLLIEKYGQDVVERFIDSMRKN